MEVVGPPPRIRAGWVGSESVAGVGSVDGGVVEGIDDGEAVRIFLLGLALEV